MKKITFLNLVLIFSMSLVQAQFTDGGISYNITSIPSLTVAVGDNQGLTGSITIPETVTDGTDTYTVTSVKGWAFAQGDGATSSISSITLPNTIITIENDAFANNTLLTTVSFGNSITTIGQGAFYKAGLTELTLPNSMTTINNVAFFANVNLTDVTIGNSIATIGSQAFAYCHPLADISIYSTSPPAVNANTFEGLTLSGINLGVPTASITTYSSISIWEDFNIIDGTVAVTNNLELNNLIKIYPNPTSDYIYLKLPNEIKLHEIVIYNTNGMIIQKATINKLNLEKLSSGVYHILISTDKGNIHKNIIKS